MKDLADYFAEEDAKSLAKARADIEREQNDPFFLAAAYQRREKRQAELDAMPDTQEDEEDELDAMPDTQEDEEDENDDAT